jgi:hypothetical protein
VSAAAVSTEELADAAGRRVRRYVNVSIHAAAVRLGDEFALWEFMCECGDLGCNETVVLSVSAFDRASEPGAVSAH